MLLNILAHKCPSQRSVTITFNVFRYWANVVKHKDHSMRKNLYAAKEEKRGRGDKLFTQNSLYS